MLHRPGDRTRHAAPERRRRVRPRGVSASGEGSTGDGAWLASDFDLTSTGAADAGPDVETLDDAIELDQTWTGTEPDAPEQDRDPADGGDWADQVWDRDGEDDSGDGLEDTAEYDVLAEPDDDDEEWSAEEWTDAGGEDWTGQVWAEDPPPAPAADPDEWDEDWSGDARQAEPARPDPTAGAGQAVTAGFPLLQAATFFTMGVPLGGEDGATATGTTSTDGEWAANSCAGGTEQDRANGTEQAWADEAGAEWAGAGDRTAGPGGFPLLQAATLYTIGVPLAEEHGAAAASAAAAHDETWAGEVWADEDRAGDWDDAEDSDEVWAPAEATAGQAGPGPGPEPGFSMLQAATLYTIGAEEGDAADPAQGDWLEDDDAADMREGGDEPAPPTARNRRRPRRGRRFRHANKAARQARRTASRQGVLGVVFLVVVGIALSGALTRTGRDERSRISLQTTRTTTSLPTFSAAEVDDATLETLPTVESGTPATTAVTALPFAATTAPAVASTTTTTRPATPRTTAAPTTTVAPAPATTLPPVVTTTVPPEPVTTTTTRPPTTTSTSTTSTTASTTTTSTTTTTTTTTVP